MQSTVGDMSTTLSVNTARMFSQMQNSLCLPINLQNLCFSAARKSHNRSQTKHSAFAHAVHILNHTEYIWACKVSE